MNSQALRFIDAGTATSGALTWRGGRGSFLAHATAWNGATCTLQTLGPDNTTWIAAGTDTTLTADGGGNFELPPGQLRAAVTGGPPTALSALAGATQ